MWFYKCKKSFKKRSLFIIKLMAILLKILHHLTINKISPYIITIAFATAQSKRCQHQTKPQIFLHFLFFEELYKRFNFQIFRQIADKEL